MTSPRSGPKDEIRVLLLHPANWKDATITRTIEKLRGVALQAAALAANPRTNEAAVRVVSARDDWQAHVRTTRPDSRVWAAWASDVATGSQRDGQPTYHAYVTPWGVEGPRGPVSRETAQVIEMALKTQKPVLSWNPSDGRAAPVVKVNGKHLEIRPATPPTPTPTPPPTPTPTPPPDRA